MALVFILNGEKRKHSEQLEWFLWGGKLIKEIEFFFFKWLRRYFKKMLF